MANNDTEPVCGLDGNPDLTGLGVRSAFYIQAITFAIAGQYLDGEAVFLHSSVVGLSLAMLVALLRETIKGTILAPEVIVVLSVICLQFMSSTVTVLTPLLEGTKKDSSSTLLNLTVQYSVALTFIGYSAWYWFVGLDSLPRTACTEWAFMIRKIDIRDGTFRLCNKIAALVCSAIFGLITLILLSELLGFGVFSESSGFI